jgi:5-methylthioadenosine/S-adenosylhomocysteine deaminase
MLLVDVRRPTLSPVHTAPMRNLAPNLVYSARGDEVDIVIVDGQIGVEHGQVRTLDEAAILTNAERLGVPIGAAAESAFWQVNGRNAHMMRAGQL